MFTCVKCYLLKSLWVWNRIDKTKEEKFWKKTSRLWRKIRRHKNYLHAGWRSLWPSWIGSRHFSVAPTFFLGLLPPAWIDTALLSDLWISSFNQNSPANTTRPINQKVALQSRFLLLLEKEVSGQELEKNWQNFYFAAEPNRSNWDVSQNDICLFYLV